LDKRKFKARWWEGPKTVAVIKVGAAENLPW
jgi:hypothetical protein